MMDAPLRRSILSSPRATFSALLIAALSVATVNAAVFAGRAAYRIAEGSGGSRERAAKQAARLLDGHPGPLILALPADDGNDGGGATDTSDPRTSVGALAFELRLRYECYPRRIQVVRIQADNPVEAKTVAALSSHHAPAAVLTYGLDLVPSPEWTVRRLPGSAIAIRRGAPSSAATDERRSGSARFLVWLLGIGALYGLGGCISSLAGAPGRSWPARIAVWHLIGTAAMTALTSLYALISGRLMVWPSYALLGLALVAAMRLRCRSSHEAEEPHHPRAEDRQPHLTAALALALLGLGIIGILATVAGTGLSWDGWTIWQMKARAFFHDGTLAFLLDPAHDASHRDYPLLVPLHTWWAYVHAGADTDKLAQVMGLLFAVDLAALAWAFARSRAGRVAGLTSAAIVVSQPMVMRHATSGYADVPLAAYLLATAYLLSTERSQSAHAGCLRLATLMGLVVAGCIFTKNEGAAALLGMTCVFAVGAIRREVRTATAIALVVAVLCVAPWWAIRARHGLQSDLYGTATYPVSKAALGAHQRETRSPLPRLPVIALYGVRKLAGVGPANPAWGLAWLIAAVAVAMAIRSRRARPAACHITREPLILLTIQAFAYLIAFLTTPHNLEWHLETSLDRLMLHGMPLAVVIGVSGLLGRAASKAGGMLDERAIQTEPPG